MKLLKANLNEVSIIYGLSVTVTNHEKSRDLQSQCFFNFQDKKIIKINNWMNCSAWVM